MENLTLTNILISLILSVAGNFAYDRTKDLFEWLYKKPYIILFLGQGLFWIGISLLVVTSAVTENIPFDVSFNGSFIHVPKRPCDSNVWIGNLRGVGAIFFGLGITFTYLLALVKLPLLETENNKIGNCKSLW